MTTYALWIQVHTFILPFRQWILFANHLSIERVHELKDELPEPFSEWQWQIRSSEGRPIGHQSEKRMLEKDYSHNIDHEFFESMIEKYHTIYPHNIPGFYKK